jgi:F-type H+-transporting ATPase subunit a
MMEHELWFTALLNKLLAGVVSPMLDAFAQINGLAWVRPEDPAHPIPNYVAMQVMVILVILLGAILLRRRLSVESPGKFQHAMEVVVEFTRDMNAEIIGHGSERYIGMIATLGIFVLLCNLWGLVPSLSTPTAKIQVTLGCAVAAFLYYNFHGMRQQGVVGYLKHLCGPMMAIAIIMFPIEVISNFGRLLSLSVRLMANMMVGNVLESVFGEMIPGVVHSLFGANFIGEVVPALISGTVPVLFMALHVFVSLLQAYIFMLLPAIYISMAVTEEH